MPADTTELRSIRNENKNSENFKNPFKENDEILNFFGKTIRPNHTRYLKELLSGNQNQKGISRIIHNPNANNSTIIEVLPQFNLKSPKVNNNITISLPEPNLDSLQTHCYNHAKSQCCNLTIVIRHAKCGITTFPEKN